MRRIILAIFFFTGIYVYGQPMKVLYLEGTVTYLGPNEHIMIKSGQILLEKNIFIGENSQLIFHNGKKYAAIKDKGLYTHVQLANLLKSTKGAILSTYAHYMYYELFHHENQIQFDNKIGVERGSRKSQIVITDAPLMFVSDTVTRHMRGLEVVDSSLYTTGEIVPITIKTIEGNNVIDKMQSFANLLDDSGKVVIKTNQPFIFRVRNESTQPVFFTLLDIQADNKVNIVILADSTKSEKYYILPGKTWDSPILGCFPPYGIEVWKLIATKRPFNLDSFLYACQSTQQTVGTIVPFETLYAKSLNSKTKQTISTEMNLKLPGQISIYSLSFELKK
ncbi:MAG: hypothetical protein WCO44_01305 [Bacteroidota bacterium]